MLNGARNTDVEDANEELWMGASWQGKISSSAAQACFQGSGFAFTVPFPSKGAHVYRGSVLVHAQLFNI